MKGQSISGTLQESVLGSAVLNILVTGINSSEGSKFAGDTK